MKAPQRILKRKIKILSSELKMLQSYRTEIALLNDDYKSEFLRDMLFLEGKLAANSSETASSEDPDDVESKDTLDTLKIDPSKSNQRWRKTDDGWELDEDEDGVPEESPIEEKPDVPAWAKKLYKKIALAAHPDRTLKEEEDKRRRLNRLFADAAQAIADGEFKSLLGYALELDIEVDDDPSNIPLLKARVNSLKEEISQIQGSLEWLWGEHLGVHDVRSRIAAGYFSSKNVLLKNEDLLATIKEMEQANESRGSS
jgi:hypothetical protein